MKIKKILFSIISLVLVTVALTGCFSEDTTSIKITKFPSAAFEQVENETEVNVEDLVTVEINGTDTVKISIVKGEVVCDKGSFEITLRGFSLKYVGSFTAVVVYKDVSSYFDYQVVSSTSKFAGGDGSKSHPYEITKVEHLKAMNDEGFDTKGKYFVLKNDIDLADEKGVTVESSKHTDTFNTVIKEFSGTFDGNGKMINNLKIRLIGDVVGATIRNLDVNVVNTGLFMGITGTTTLEDVDVYGNIDSDNNRTVYAKYFSVKASNLGLYQTNLVCKGCDSHVSIVGQGDKVAIFFGFIYNHSSFTNSISLTNCNNEGQLEGMNVGFLTCNVSSDCSNLNVTLTGCANNGHLVQTDGSQTDALCALSGNNLKANAHGITKTIVPSLGVDEGVKFATLKVDENTGEWYLQHNSAETVQADHFVVSIVVPVRNASDTLTNRPNISSKELKFGTSERINLGISSKEYTRVNEKGTHDTSAAAVFGEVAWLALNGTTMSFDSQACFGEAGWVFNREAPYFVVFAYDANNTIIAATAKTSLNVK